MNESNVSRFLITVVHLLVPWQICEYYVVLVHLQMQKLPTSNMLSLQKNKNV